MAAGAASLEPLDPFKPQPKMSYKDGYQKRWATGQTGRGAGRLEWVSPLPGCLHRL